MLVLAQLVRRTSRILILLARNGPTALKDASGHRDNANVQPAYFRMLKTAYCRLFLVQGLAQSKQQNNLLKQSKSKVCSE